MITSQKRILLVLFIAGLLMFSRSHLLFAQKIVNENSEGNTEIVGDQEGELDFDNEYEDDEIKKVEVKKIEKKLKKYRRTKYKLTSNQKKQKLIERELKRFEKAKKSISIREKRAKKILKKAKLDREKELIKHDNKIQEIDNMELDE